MNVKTQPLVGNQSRSVALENSHRINAGSGILGRLVVTNTGPAQFIQLHDSATVPAEGSVPLLPIPAPANTVVSVDIPIRFLNGIYACNSSTADTKTIGAADCWFLAANF